KAFLEFINGKGTPLTLKDYVTKYQGHSNKENFPAIFGKKLSKKEIVSFTNEKEEVYRRMYTQVEPLGGFLEILDKAKSMGLKIALATLAPKQNRDYIIDKLNLRGVFDVIVGDEGVSKGKPDLEIYLSTAKELGIDPKDCLVFEDSIPGVQSAKRAGMKVVALSTTHQPTDLTEADFIIPNFSEVDLTSF
ncbi:MAG: HAD family phosphatase, partial [Chloroflexi bacterium]|nr:HAD family phosphatase [Chloroflexota bacterium]